MKIILQILIGFWMIFDTCELVLFTRSNIFGACNYLSILVQVNLFNTNSTLSPLTNKVFQMANNYNYQQFNLIGLALNGFQVVTSTTISYTASASYSYSNNTFIITLIQNTGSSFNYMTFTVIIVSNSASNIL